MSWLGVVSFREVCHKPLRQMQSPMPNIEVTVPRFWSTRSESVFISNRTAMGCEDGFAPRLRVPLWRIFTLLTCVALAA
jgi:hypothetical protein